MFNAREKNGNKTQGTGTLEPKKHLLPPSDIVGKVAEEILRKANVSEEEANKELIRVEKVDEILDKDKNHKPKHELLKKVKEARGLGGKNSAEKKLVRVERVDLTDEEEDEEKELEKPAHEPAKGKRLSRMQSSTDSRTEDLESAHARRFGITNATSDILKHNASMENVNVQSSNLTNRNTTIEAPTSTLPPFFAKFLSITAKERKMVDLLNNFTDNSKPLDEPKTSISHQRNETKEEKPKMVESMDMTSAHADKVVIRDKRDHKEATLLDALVTKLLNITGEKKPSSGQHNGSELLRKPFNLSGILEKITERNQNRVNKDGMHSSLSDSTALLLKFLKEGNTYQLRMPHNVTAAHTNKDNSKSVVSEPQPSSEGTFNLRKILLQLANHIDLNSHGNHSETTLDQENKADLMMLKLLLHQNDLQDLSTFNLSRVLKDIPENSLENTLTALQPVKVKREEFQGDLGSTDYQSGIKIFRPDRDKLETSTPDPVLNTERKANSLLDGNQMLSSKHDSLNTMSVGISSRSRTSVVSGSGSGESGDEESGRRFV